MNMFFAREDIKLSTIMALLNERNLHYWPIIFCSRVNNRFPAVANSLKYGC